MEDHPTGMGRRISWAIEFSDKSTSNGSSTKCSVTLPKLVHIRKHRTICPRILIVWSNSDERMILPHCDFMPHKPDFQPEGIDEIYSVVIERHIHIQPARNADRVVTQPSSGNGVIPATAKMVQACSP